MRTAGLWNENRRWRGLCLCWAADLTLLAFCFFGDGLDAGVVCFFVIGSLLTFFLVRFCPQGPTGRRVFLQLFSIAVFGRLVFLFFAVSGSSVQALQDWQAVYFRMALILSDLALVCLLARFLRMRRLPLSRLLIYAANPLVVTAVAGFAEPEVLLAPLFLAALTLLLSKKTGPGFAALGASAVNPLLAAAAWPYFVDRRNWKKSLLALAPLPLLIAGGRLDLWTAAGRGAVDPAAAVLQAFFGSGATTAALLLWIGCVLLIYLVEPDPARDAYLAIGALLVLTGGTDPSRLVLIAPLCCMFVSGAWLYLMAAAVFFFPAAVFGTWAPGFSDIRWLMWAVYTPFPVLLLWGVIRKRYLFDNQAFSPPSSLAVIIPTLDEAGNICACLASLAGQSAVTEIVVADGGSADGTPGLAEREGARVIRSRRGRGHQVAAGIDAAIADVYLVVHADARLNPRAAERILRQLRARPDAPGGAFGMRFEGSRFKSRLIAGLNNIRSEATGISFGDQGQFFRREALSLVGGYPAMSLMEDVEAAMRLKSVGSPLFLAKGIVVSDRRWVKPGFGANVRVVLRLCLRYLFERRLSGRDIDAEYYYRVYYRKG